MNLTTIDGHSEAIVAKVAGTVAKDALISFATDLADGEVVTVNKSNVVVDATNIAAAGLVRLVTNRNGKLRYSEFFQASTINNKTVSAYVAPTYKSSTIGYNGTTGNMDTTADRELTIKLYDESKERLFETKDMYSIGHTVIPESATEAEVTSDLFDSLVGNSQRGEAFVNTSMILSGTVTAGQNAVVSNGGKTVTFATAVVGILVGSYLSFNGAFYKVVALANTNKTATLKTAYQGASGTILATNVKAMTPTVALTAQGGIKITVVQREHFRTGVTSYIVFNYALGITGFEVATITELAQSSQGSGTAKQIAELEWYAEGNQGSTQRMEGALGVGPEFVPSVVMTNTYKQTIMAIETKAHKTIFGGAPTFDNQITLAVPTGVTCLAETALAAL